MVDMMTAIRTKMMAVVIMYQVPVFMDVQACLVVSSFMPMIKVGLIKVGAVHVIVESASIHVDVSELEL